MLNIALVHAQVQVPALLLTLSPLNTAALKLGGLTQDYTFEDCELEAAGADGAFLARLEAVTENLEKLVETQTA